MKNLNDESRNDIKITNNPTPSGNKTKNIEVKDLFPYSRLFSVKITGSKMNISKRCQQD